MTRATADGGPQRGSAESEPMLTVISSMATRRVLAELIESFEAESTWRAALESVGGVNAAARVRAGEPFDVVVLARDVIEDLIREERVAAGSRVDLARSAIAAMVRRGAAHPDISSTEAVQHAVLAARTVGYSTGPSGTHLANLFAEWGIADTLQGRMVVAPPGVPVAALVARGEVALGFQQLSEVIDADGIDVVGMLPPGSQSITIFSGGVIRTSTRPDGARALLQFLARSDSAIADIKRRNGMEPA